MKYYEKDVSTCCVGLRNVADNSRRVEWRRLEHCPQRQIVTVESRRHEILDA